MNSRRCTGSLGVVLLAYVSMARAGETFNATVTSHSGNQTAVKDARLVYSWRELPLQAEGLVRYEDRRQVEQGFLLIAAAAPKVGLVPLGEVSAVEFETEVRQRGGSLSYQFVVRRILLIRHDGQKTDCSASWLAESSPVLWPHGKSLQFPDTAQNKRIEQRGVSLQGKTKTAEGEDALYSFAFPPVMQEAIQSVMRKRQEAFPRRIEFTPGPALP